MTTTINTSMDVRALTDDELDRVSGGIDDGAVASPNKPKCAGRA